MVIFFGGGGGGGRQTHICTLSSSFVYFVVQIPTILADNAGYDSAGLVAQLKAEHAQGNTTAGLGTLLPCVSTSFWSSPRGYDAQCMEMYITRLLLEYLVCTLLQLL